MKMENGRFVVYGNAISESHSQQAVKWQRMFVNASSTTTRMRSTP